MGGSVIQGFFPRGVMVSGSAAQQAIVRAGGAALQARTAGAVALPPHFAHTPATGRPLPSLVRQKMEALFGARFDDVRIHVGPQAQTIGALAYTHGSHIHFAPGHYSPVRPDGQRILAHELTHVVQQRLRRVSNPFGSGVAVVQNKELEAEAERMAARAAMTQIYVPKPQRAVQRIVAAPGIIQRVRAFRVDSTPLNRKVELDDDNKLVAFHGQEHGIDISFGEDTHAMYYFNTKKSDPDSVLDEWDFPDDLYAALYARMKFPMKQERPDDVSEKIWAKVKKLPAPVNSSDGFVRDHDLVAPHFPGDWIDLLTAACKGRKVRRISAKTYFEPDKKPSVTVIATPQNTDTVDVYFDGDFAFKTTYGEFVTDNLAADGYTWRV